MFVQAAAGQQAAEKEADPAEAGPASTAQQEPAEATPQQVTCLPSLHDTCVEMMCTLCIALRQSVGAS